MHSVSEDFEANHLAPAMVFVANWALPKNMSIASNWVLSYNVNDPNPTGKYIVNFGFPIYNKFSSFVENYGQVNQSVFQTRFDGGFAYLVTKNLLIDLFAGYGHNQNATDYFVSTGIN